MFNINSIFGRCVLALAFLTGSATAVAGPTYHVNVDSARQKTQDGYLILSFLNTSTAAPATARVSNWSGSFLGTGMSYGDDADVSVDFATRMLTLVAGTNGYLFDVNFGGLFGFDVTFDTENVAAETNFGVALSDAEGNYAGGGDVANIVLGTSGPAQLSVNADYASITPAASAVPEPAELALVLTGLGLMGLMRRRRS